VDHWAIKSWGPIVNSQGSTLNSQVADYVTCGIYDKREEDCDDAATTDCEVMGLDNVFGGKKFCCAPEGPAGAPDRPETPMSALVPYGMIKLRYLMKFCVDKNWKNHQGKCCRNGMAGRFCIYVNDVAGQTYDGEYTRKSFDRYNSQLLLDGAKPCDFGYCTDGDVNAGKVRRCRLTVSKPVLKAPMVSALQTIIS
jgi:hypothetical protein